MWRSKKWPVLLAVVVVLAFSFRVPTEKYFDIAKSLDIFATLFKEVNAYYVDDVDPEKLIGKSIEGMLSSLDPYTDYIPEDQIESFRISTTGQYAGIGALIGQVNGKAVITHPYKGFPAFKTGLRVGDEIIAVNGQNVQGKSTSEISSLLKGQPRTEVEVTVRRYGEENDIVLKIRRDKISVRNIAYYGMAAPGVGYIKLDDFTPGAAREVADALEELKKQGAEKMILDLRENPGGLLHEAVNIVGLFIPKGFEVVSTRGRADEWNKTYKTLNNPIDTQIPLAILTSNGSASASEIVAGALQDYDRAVLIGQKTFGKGLVQTTRSLAYNAQLKVTTAKYYIPSGRCIQALDYAHRKDDGTVERFADSLKKEFTTKGGRKVYDGGGLDPDIPVQEQFLGTITVQLINSGLLFEYASKYVAENPVRPDLKNFRLSDQDYQKFVDWLKGQPFHYVAPIENYTRELIEVAKKEGIYAQLQNHLDQLKESVEKNKAQDFIRFKDEITDILEREIAFHYDLSEGEAQVSLARDEEIKRAISVLNDQASYKNLLSPI